MEGGFLGEVAGGDEFGFGGVGAFFHPVGVDGGFEGVEVGALAVFLAAVGDAADGEDGDGGEDAEDDDDDEEFDEGEPSVVSVGRVGMDLHERMLRPQGTSR